jgi:NADP-dependent 3-hydroxy acid dehydrogenase YdfG
VAIVTGGSRALGRDLALELATRGYAIVVVYLEDQDRAEATVEEVSAAGGAAVALRADLSDALDVERTFTESIAVFGGIDLVVDTTEENITLLHRQAAQHLRRDDAILRVSDVAGLVVRLDSRQDAAGQ